MRGSSALLKKMLQGLRVYKCLKVKVTVTSLLPYLRQVALDPIFFRKVRHFCVPLSAPIVMSKLLVFRVRNQRAVIANYPDRSEFNWRRGLGKQLVVFWCSAARASAAIGTTPSTEREQPAEVATFTATPYWLHAIPLYCCVSSSILRWDKLVPALASEAQCRAATGALVMLKPRS